jgi:hypothetical protein
MHFRTKTQQLAHEPSYPDSDHARRDRSRLAGAAAASGVPQMFPQLTHANRTGLLLLVLSALGRLLSRIFMSFSSKSQRNRNRNQKRVRDEEKLLREQEEVAQASKKQMEDDTWQQHKDSQHALPAAARAVKAAVFSLDTNPLRPRTGTILERCLTDDKIRDYFGYKGEICKASFYKAKTAEKERKRKVHTAQFFAEDTAREMLVQLPVMQQEFRLTKQRVLLVRAKRTAKIGWPRSILTQSW